MATGGATESIPIPLSRNRAIALGALATLCVGILIAGQVWAMDGKPQHRLIEYEGITIDIAGLPMSGSPQADHVLVEFFDYTCQTCRKLHGYLDETLEHYGDQVAVVYVPVPGDAACNPKVRITNPKRRGACEYAKLALAIWRINPAQFQVFHNWLNDGLKAPPVEEVRRYAIELVGEQPLNEAVEKVVDDQTIAACLELNEDVYLKAKEQGKLHKDHIPKLVIGPNAVMIGLPKSEQSLFDEIEKTLLILLVDSE